MAHSPGRRSGAPASFFVKGKLPKGWEVNLPLRAIMKVLAIESAADRGEFRLYGKHEDGYPRVALCRRHPFANSGGWQYLHRYLLMRSLGERLSSEEHAHHSNGAPKDSTNVRDLHVMGVIDHGVYHRGVRRRTHTGPELWGPRDAKGRFTKLPTREALDAAWSRAAERHGGST